MTYWFHRECLERNDIVKQLNKYEFDNLQECVNDWILGEGKECDRCHSKGASIKCPGCEKSFHGYKCSFMRMAKDYDGVLVCLHCLPSRLSQKLSDEYLDEVDKKLMKDDIYKSINREMFYDNNKNMYAPQLEDEVYFIFQGYEEAIAFYPYHFITLEKERNKPIDNFHDMFLTNNNIMAKSHLTHCPLK